MNNIIKSIAVFGISNLLSKVLSSLVIPLFVAKYIDKDNFAASDIIISFFSLVALFTSLSLESALARYYYNSDLKDNLLATISSVITIISVIATTIFIFNAKRISFLLFDSEAYYIQCIIGSLIIVTTNMSSIVNLYLRFSEKLREFMVISIIQFVLILLFLFLTFKFSKISINTILLSILIQGSIPIIFFFIFRHKNFRISFDKTTLKICLKYSIPLVPITVMVWVNMYLNRFLLQHSKGLQFLSDYMIAIKIASIINLIESVFNMFWQPFFLKRFSDKNNYPKFEFMFRISITIMFLIYIVCVFFYPTITRLVYGSKFSLSNNYFGIISLAFILNIFNSLIGIGINAKNKTMISSLIFIFTSLLGVSISYSLLEFYNTIGLVYSTLIISFINLGITAIITKKLTDIHYNYLYLLLCILISISFYAINIKYDNNLSLRVIFFIISFISITLINIKYITTSSFFKLKLFK